MKPRPLRIRRRSGDTRPDPTDPNMPVLIQMADTNQLEPFPPDEAQAAFKHWHENNEEPSWRDDPTYNLRKKK